MVVKKDSKEELSQKTKQTKVKEEKTFEQKKHEAYAAMGRLGGQARVKQLVEQGFVKKESFLKNLKKKEKK
ncbi:MAG: hypothetical protein K2W92_08250 [Alphaproteobacteria bacterium]|nr:hypothetical protein [Alphaproteobacteria bacterium]